MDRIFYETEAWDQNDVMKWLSICLSSSLSPGTMLETECSLHDNYYFMIFK